MLFCFDSFVSFGFVWFCLRFVVVIATAITIAITAALIFRFGSLLRFVHSRRGEIAHTHHSISSHKRLHSLQTPISTGRTETAVFINTDAINQSTHTNKPKTRTAFSCPNLHLRDRISLQRNQPESHLEQNYLLTIVNQDFRLLELSCYLCKRQWNCRVVARFLQEHSGQIYGSNEMGIDALIALQNQSSTRSHLRWLAPGEDFHSRH